VQVDAAAFLPASSQLTFSNYQREFEYQLPLELSPKDVNVSFAAVLAYQSRKCVYTFQAFGEFSPVRFR
jgi:hypothetical protein